MHDITKRYRSENGASLIEISLDSPHQLFNTFDPSPFHDKDLDADAEDYIVGAVREFSLHAPLRLVLYLPAGEVGRLPADHLAQSIRNYFAYRREAAARDLRFQLRQGRTALVIGLSFLVGCFFLREAITLLGGTSTLSRTLAEGLLIAGWVAMWRPINVFLYEWWPLRRMARVYHKIAAMDVEVRAGAAPAFTRPGPAQRAG